MAELGGMEVRMARGKVVAEEAYTYIRRRLLEGGYDNGELLSEAKVADGIGVSRTPVREAFLRLEAEGFLKLLPKRGALVVPIGIDDGRNILQARLLLESFAIDKVAATTAARIAQLGAELRDLLEAQDAAEPWEASYRFHQHLIAFAANPVILDQYERLWGRQLRLSATSVNSPERAQQDADEHLFIADALQQCLPGTARQLLEKHLRDVLPHIGLDPAGAELPPPAQDPALVPAGAA